MQRQVKASITRTEPLVWLPVCLLLLSACQTLNSTDRLLAKAVAEGFQVARLQVAGLPFLTLNKLCTNSNSLRIYIEGDGRSWITRHRYSLDPTPENPLALRLALQDAGDTSIAYLSRPCQYALKVERSSCSPRLWTRDQYSETVISAFNSVIDRLKGDAGADELELIGYSGGATVALLIAARRSDIKKLRSIAGNLDPTAFAAHHKVSVSNSALNPSAYTDKLVSVPQLHLVGAEDLIVPEQIANAYLQNFEDKRCIAKYVLAGVDHSEGWESDWSRLLIYPLRCRTD